MRKGFPMVSIVGGVTPFNEFVSNAVTGAVYHILRNLKQFKFA